MTSISGVGGIDMSQVSLMVGGMSGTQGAPPPPPPDGGGKMEEEVIAAAEEAGLDDETIESLCEELRSAIDAAMEGFDGTTDPREAIDAAVSGVLEEYGIDPDAVSEQMSGMGPPPEGMMGASGESDLLSQTYSAGTTGTDSLTSLLMSLSLVDVEA